MTDRVVKVSLVASVGNYLSDMEQVRKKTSETATETQKLAEKKQGLEEVGKAGMVMGGLMLAGVGLAVAKFVEFDKAMSQVKAATQETTGNMALLRAAAIEAGAKTIFSATEAANAIEELGKAGVSTKDILAGGLDGALALAASGGIAVADAAAIAATALTQFKLKGQDIPHVADLLSAAAGKAQGSVQDLGLALAQGGLVAAQSGQSIEQTTGTLAAFASAGLLGADAGTSLKTAILALESPSTKAQKVMDQYGISVYDAQGNMLSLSGIAGVLSDKMGGLTQQQRNAALSTIFGSDAIRSASILYDQGAKGIQSWIDKTNDSGYAAKVAADRMNNLAGDVEQLSGSLDTALIQSGSAANGILRGLTQTATVLVNAIGGLPAPALAAGLAITGVTGAILLTAGATLTVIPRLGAMKSAMDTLGITAKGTAISVGLISGALTAVTLVIGAALTQYANQAALVDSLASSYDKATGKITSYTREVVAKKLAESGAYDVAAKAGVSQKELTDAILKGGDAWQKYRDILGGQNTVGGIFDGTSLSAVNAAAAVRDLGEGMASAKQQQKDIAAATGDATAKTQAQTAATQAQAAATDAMTKAQAEWMKAVAKSDADFVDLGGAYDAALQKAQDLASGTSKSADKVGSALQAMKDSAKVSVGDYIKQLQDQVDAQTNWEHNMVLLAARVPAEMLKELSDMGPKGAAEVALMSKMTDDELAKTVDLWKQRAAEATGQFADTLDQAGPTIAKVAAKYGQTAVDALSDKLSKGEGIDQALAELGLKLDEKPPIITPHVNTAPAMKDFDNTQAYGEAMKIWLHAQGDTVPARSAFSSERDYQEGLKLWLTAHGETRPARADFESAQQYAEALKVYMTALGNTKPVRGDFDSAKAYGDALRAWITAMANTDPAEQALEAVANRKRYATIQAVIAGGTDPGQAKAAYPTNATGGYISGPGTGTSDSILSWLSNGEYVVNAAATQRNRALLEAINSGVQGYATGGYVRGDSVRYTQGGGSAAGMAAAAPQFNVVVQSKGGVDLLKYVDVSIQAADRSRDTASSMGWSVTR